MYSIYLNIWGQGVLSFSTADSAVLYNIAIQEPLEAGDAVYSARVMLGLDPSSFRSNRMMEYGTTENSSNEETNFSKIYPNPTNGIMQLDYILKEGQQGELTIFDLMGNKISRYSLTANNTGTLQINESNLSDGVYFYSIKVNGEIKESDKIVIIK